MKTKLHGIAANFLSFVLLFGGLPITARAQGSNAVSGSANGLSAAATVNLPLTPPLTVSVVNAAPVTLPSTGAAVADQVLSVSVGIPSVLPVASTGVITNSSAGAIAASSATASSSSRVDNLNILSGFITADVVESKANSSGNGTAASSNGNGSQIVGLRIGGVLDPRVTFTPNTVIAVQTTLAVTVPPLGTLVNVPVTGNVTLNAQATGGNGTTTSSIDVTQLAVALSGSVNALGIGLVQVSVNVSVAMASSGVNFTAAPNRCPNVTVSGGTSRSVQAGQNLSFQVSATDPDGDQTTLSATNLPANASFTPNPATGTPTATGTFSFTPTAAQVGQSFNVLFTAGDNRGCSSGAPVTVQISVTPGGTPNRCPSINVPAIAQTVVVGQALTFPVSATDPDGDTVTLNATNMPANASFTPNPASGTPTASGVFSFTPSVAQANVTFTVNFTATDNRGCGVGSAVPVSVTINVFEVPPEPGANNCPVVTVPPSQNVAIGSTLTFNVSATDPDGDTVTLAASNLPANASFTPNPASGTPTASGAFSFTPTAAQAGQTFVVTFTAADSRGCTATGGGTGAGGTNVKSVTVTVGQGGGGQGPCGNHAPIISVPLLPVIGLNRTLGFLVRATDQDGDDVELSAELLPENATFNAATGLVTYMPSEEQLKAAKIGQSNVAYFVAEDSKGAVATAKVDLTAVVEDAQQKNPLLSVPAGPVLVRVTDTLRFGVASMAQTPGCSSTISSSISVNDSSALAAAIDFDFATNFFTFRPTADQVGMSYVARFTATDCSGRSATRAVRIIVIDADANCVAKGAGKAEVVAKRIDFTNTKVGDISGAVTVSLTNRGGGPLLISSIGLDDVTNYRVEGMATLPAVLQPGGVIEFKVFFEPKSKGASLALLTLTTTDPDTPLIEVRLKGKASN